MLRLKQFDGVAEGAKERGQRTDRRDFVALQASHVLTNTHIHRSICKCSIEVLHIQYLPRLPQSHTHTNINICTSTNACIGIHLRIYMTNRPARASLRASWRPAPSVTEVQRCGECFQNVSDLLVYIHIPKFISMWVMEHHV